MFLELWITWIKQNVQLLFVGIARSPRTISARNKKPLLHNSPELTLPLHPMHYDQLGRFYIQVYVMYGLTLTAPIRLTCKCSSFPYRCNKYHNFKTIAHGRKIIPPPPPVNSFTYRSFSKIFFNKNSSLLMPWFLTTYQNTNLTRRLE
jgi:hypothetical protein